MDCMYPLRDTHLERFFPTAVVEYKQGVPEDPFLLQSFLLRLLADTPAESYPFIEKLVIQGEELLVSLGSTPREYYLPDSFTVRDYFDAVEYEYNMLLTDAKKGTAIERLYKDIKRVVFKNPWYPCTQSSEFFIEACRQRVDNIEHQPAGFLEVL